MREGKLSGTMVMYVARDKLEQVKGFAKDFFSSEVMRLLSMR